MSFPRGTGLRPLYMVYIVEIFNFTTELWCQRLWSPEIKMDNDGWCSMELDEGLNGLFMVAVRNVISSEVRARLILGNGEAMVKLG
ncbi:hypothetical protein V6N11_001506 [Hibiscus sabdariffa]|uniref:Uncharacterized protein n=1 Tax=Hibiscus sabdariffa TaxID=183260 RepID=A0ABR2S0N6_9ROSI